MSKPKSDLKVGPPGRGGPTDSSGNADGYGTESIEARVVDGYWLQRGPGGAEVRTEADGRSRLGAGVHRLQRAILRYLDEVPGAAPERRGGPDELIGEMLRDPQRAYPVVVLEDEDGERFEMSVVERIGAPGEPETPPGDGWILQDENECARLFRRDLAVPPLLN